MVKERWDPEGQKWVSHAELLAAERDTIVSRLEKAVELPRTELHALEHRLEEINLELNPDKAGGDNVVPKKSSIVS